jgi:microcystin degradation protein MlrC
MTTTLLHVCTTFDSRPAALSSQMPVLGLDDKIAAISDLATDAQAAGQGASLDARFSRNADADWTTPACVLALHGEPVRNRHCIFAGNTVPLGPAQIVEVDAPGLTSPVLSRFDWTHLPRPVLPLDAEVTWP